MQSPGLYDFVQCWLFIMDRYLRLFAGTVLILGAWKSVGEGHG